MIYNLFLVIFSIRRLRSESATPHEEDKWRLTLEPDPFLPVAVVASAMFSRKCAVFCALLLAFAAPAPARGAVYGKKAPAPVNELKHVVTEVGAMCKVYVCVYGVHHLPHLPNPPRFGPQKQIKIPNL